MRIYFTILSLFISVLTFAQTTISGTVTDAKSQPVPGANVKIVGASAGTSTGFDGKFLLKTQNAFPFTLEVSMMGFGSQTLEVASKEQEIVVVLVEESTSLNEIVVSASRAPERIIESPVTIERMGLKDIKNTTAPSFYEGLENLKDVHFNTSSFNFKSINTRGFATVANSRFMQLVDGMDNSSPALNFVLGNLLGVSDVDVANVEILPGASSALYGANAFNGIMFMNSRSPFTKEGISTYFKYGRTSQNAAGENPFYDFGVRVAKKFTDHFAAKANFTYMEATEWIANDTRSLTDGGVGHDVNQNYDGLNLYGDEVTTFIPNVGQVSRTGYREQDLNDSKIKNAKFDASLHFRPWANSSNNFAKGIEIIGQHKLGFGNTVYQGANRYALKDFYMDQTKFEVKGDNFFVRAYRTAENAGNSYDMRFAAWNINREAKSDVEWFTNYATAFQLSQAYLGSNATQAAAIGRNYADQNILPTTAGFNLLPQFANAPVGQPRLEPGSPEFVKALAKVSSDPSLITGAKFQDNSKIHHADANYNFKNEVKFAEIQVGGSARKYTMDSNGTIFTDTPSEPLKYTEYGAYTQIQKKFLNDRAKFTGSVRYDKSQNFEGNFSPRVSMTYALGAEKKHNFRASYQTGFRNPTTQDQYIGLDLGPFALIGSAKDNLTRYIETRQISTLGQTSYGQPSSVVLTGVDAYTKSYSLKSVQEVAATGDPSKLVVANIGLVKPERVQALELGYRTIIEKLSVDISGYYNTYNDFLSQERVITPYYGFGTPLAAAAIAAGDRRVFQIYTNSDVKVDSYGVGVGVNRKVGKFDVGGSYNYSGFEFDQAADPDFIAGFNTPKHRAKGSFGSEKLFKNFGFNTNVRWNTEYLWESSFVDAVVPENVVFDAQINYSIPFLKSVVKVGGANIAGKDYIQVPGAGMIGRQYYASWTINP
ncbi:TonB-dependent receptor [Flavobacterium amnicola]|uniref:TonB-dependent receptor n=1 Tax=Flavobacterium amnicola TaxID=2506422 RepID=A0A4Q1K5B9_9FLAO|nr:TonB-dependent receptor [Flavobacterium amnicola]RXR21096.1 TonB-dependent receptor [Flavobacterium amnicola]